MKRTITNIICALCCIAAQAQWCSDSAENLLVWSSDASSVYSELEMGADGTSWLLVNYPGEDGVAVKVYAVDSTGMMLLGEEGLIVSTHPNRSWINFNKCLFVDRDNNAIVLVNDTRYSPADTVITTTSPYGMTYYQSGIFGAGSGLTSYTAYKISPQGEMLWGEDGISIDGGATHTLTCGIHTAQLDDGSYVFAWSRANGNAMVIDMSRVSADGHLLWQPGEVSLADPDMKVDYRDAYLVNAGFNQVILVYTRGSAQDLYARRIDFDGSSVWSEDTRIYRSGWGSIPIWTILDVQPSGDGGVIVSWNDDRYMTGFESAYLSYVKPNGELAFSEGTDGLKIGYSGYRALTVKCAYEPSDDSFIACWRECSSGQSYYRMVAQRVSKSGELLWGENGVELEPYENTTYAYNTVQVGNEGQVAFFYMRQKAAFGDVDAYVRVLDVKSGNPVWEDAGYIFTACDTPTEKSKLLSTPMCNKSFWVTAWHEKPKQNDESVCNIRMQRINDNRTIGNPDNLSVGLIDNNAVSYRAITSDAHKNVVFAVEVPSATFATIHIYNLSGELVAIPYEGMLTAGKQYIECSSTLPPGIYCATLVTADDKQTTKIIMK